MSEGGGVEHKLSGKENPQKRKKAFGTKNGSDDTHPKNTRNTAALGVILKKKRKKEKKKEEEEGRRKEEKGKENMKATWPFSPLDPGKTSLGNPRRLQLNPHQIETKGEGNIDDPGGDRVSVHNHPPRFVIPSDTAPTTIPISGKPPNSDHDRPPHLPLDIGIRSASYKDSGPVPPIRNRLEQKPPAVDFSLLPL